MKKLLALPILLLLGLDSCKESSSSLEKLASANESENSQSIQGSDFPYSLTYFISDKPGDPIQGKGSFRYRVVEKNDLYINFTAAVGTIREILIDGKKVGFANVGDRISLSGDAFSIGENIIDVEFVLSDKAVESSEEYMSFNLIGDSRDVLFPHLENLGVLNLSLVLPEKWLALGQTRISSSMLEGGRKKITFEPTRLHQEAEYTVVVGALEQVSVEESDISAGLYARKEMVENRKEDLNHLLVIQKEAEKWLNDYLELPAGTNSRWPTVLLPSELISESKCSHLELWDENELPFFLNDSESSTMRYTRLLSHSVVIRRLNNLIIFNNSSDQWSLLAIANVLTDQMMTARFPQADHNLRFLLSHYPKAYAMDRSQGAQAIDEASGLDTIFDQVKSPQLHKGAIVMRNILRIVGGHSFKFAIQEFLENGEGKKSDWQDLLTILDRRTDLDLEAWATVWVGQPGMPHYQVTLTQFDLESRAYDIHQIDPKGENRIWLQTINIGYEYEMGPVDFPIFMNKAHHVMRNGARLSQPNFVQMGGLGIGYGVFKHGLGYERDVFLFNQGRVDISTYEDDIRRAATYINLNEYLMDVGFDAALYFKFLSIYVKQETNTDILEYLLGNQLLIFRKFLSESEREEVVQEMEAVTLGKIQSAKDAQTKEFLWFFYWEIVSTKEGKEQLAQWSNYEDFNSRFVKQKSAVLWKMAYFNLFQSDAAIELMVSQLSIKIPADWLLLALSKDDKAIKKLIAVLESKNGFVSKDVRLMLIGYLHHFDRKESSIEYMPATLDLLSALSKSASPVHIKACLDQMFIGYQSKPAWQSVLQYVDEHRDLDLQFKAQLLQSSDMLYRAANN